jgi:hypothetical protein
MKLETVLLRISPPARLRELYFCYIQPSRTKPRLIEITKLKYAII